MDINLIPDSSVGSAPAGFTAAIQEAASIFDAAFPGNYTLNITYGWGTYDNVADDQLMGSSSAAFSIGGGAPENTVKYATAKSWLGSDAAVAALPSSAPAGANYVLLTSSQEKALGVFGGNSSAIDGSIGFNTDDGAVTSGSYYVTAALVELGHALGWYTGGETSGSSDYTPTMLDLFRYASPGVYQWDGDDSSYFSLDKGQTDLATYSTTFDTTLFTGVATNEAFNLDANKVNAQGLSTLDIEVLNVLGFGLPQVPNAVTESGPSSVSVFSGLQSNYSNKSLFSGVQIADANGALADDNFTTTVTARTGILTLAGAGVSGSGTHGVVISGLLADVNYLLPQVAYLSANVSDDTLTVDTVNTANQSSTSETIAVEVTPTTVAVFQAHEIQFESEGADFTVTDTAAHVSSFFSALNADSNVSIELTDPGKPVLTLTAAEAIGDTVALAAIRNSSYGVDIVDSAANVVNRLDALSSDSHLLAIALTDPGTPTLTLMAYQVADDGAALQAMASVSYDIDIVDTAANIAAALSSVDSLIASGRITSVSSAGAAVTMASDDTLTVLGAGNFVHVKSGAKLYLTGAWDGVSGSSASIYLTSAQTTITGGGGDVTYFSGGTDDAVSLYATTAWDGVYGSDGTIYLTDAQTTVASGGGDVIDFTGGRGNAVGLYATSAWDGVDGVNGTIYLTGAQTAVTGGGDVINFSGGANDAVGLYATSSWDGVYGSGGTIYLTGAQTAVTGGGDMIHFSGGVDDAVGISGTTAWDGVYGSGGTIYLSSAQTSVTAGGNDVIHFSGGTDDAVGISGTTAWDGVYGSGGNIYLASAQTSVTAGGNDVIHFSGGTDDAVGISGTTAWDGVYGSGGTIYLTSAQTSLSGGGNDVIDFSGGTDDAVGISGTSAWDGVYGSGGTIYLTSAQTAVTGGGDVINFSGGTGDAVGLYATSAWDGVYGSGGTIYLNAAQTAVSGGGDVIDFAGGTGDAVGVSGTTGVSDTVNGADGTIYVASAQATVNGGDDWVFMSGTSSATVNGASDAIVFYQGIGGADTISGFVSTDTVQFSHLDFASWSALQGHMTQSGANTLITLNATDTVTLANVTETSLKAGEFSFT